MLVLSRQLDQTIMIGDDVELTVVDIRGDKVRIGIEAPPDVRVLREELEPDSIGDVTLEPGAELPIRRMFNMTG